MLSKPDDVSGTELRPARAADRPKVEALLVASGLPLDGLEDHFENFVVAVAGDELVGAAGLECHGQDALLRSVVVAPHARKLGLGVRLTEVLVARAGQLGLRTISLLTTTAEPFFARRGFRRVTWGELPESLGNSRELSGACPRSAAAMRYDLGTGRPG
ncbi:MAG: arsenic resistance N-acetyltransferase ArsN2 [Myxococcaceae bacterium]|nr:arsenic resistance N-acetyltransferase ArsN2 [Myxococcaceae bacterium]